MGSGASTNANVKPESTKLLKLMNKTCTTGKFGIPLNPITTMKSSIEYSRDVTTILSNSLSRDDTIRAPGSLDYNSERRAIGDTSLRSSQRSSAASIVVVVNGKPFIVYSEDYQTCDENLDHVFEDDNSMTMQKNESISSYHSNDNTMSVEEYVRLMYDMKSKD